MRSLFAESHTEHHWTCSNPPHLCVDSWGSSSNSSNSSSLTSSLCLIDEQHDNKIHQRYFSKSEIIPVSVLVVGKCQFCCFFCCCCCCCCCCSLSLSLSFEESTGWTLSPQKRPNLQSAKISVTRKV